MTFCVVAELYQIFRVEYFWASLYFYIETYLRMAAAIASNYIV